MEVLPHRIMMLFTYVIAVQKAQQISFSDRVVPRDTLLRIARLKLGNEALKASAVLC